jgi:hypothetical protein
VSTSLENALVFSIQVSGMGVTAGTSCKADRRFVNEAAASTTNPNSTGGNTTQLTVDHP